MRKRDGRLEGHPLSRLGWTTCSARATGGRCWFGFQRVRARRLLWLFTGALLSSPATLPASRESVADYDGPLSLLDSIADGIALGASARSGESDLGLVVFLAIMIHKIPASVRFPSLSLSLSLFHSLLHSRTLTKGALCRRFQLRSDCAPTSSPTVFRNLSSV